MKKTILSFATRAGYSQLAVLLLLLSPLSPRAVPSSNDMLDARATVDHYYKQLQDLMKREKKLSEDDFTTEFLLMIDELFDLQTLAPQIVPNKWESFVPHEWNVLTAALQSSIKHKVLGYIAEDSKRRVPSVKMKENKSGSNESTLEYEIKRGRKKTRFIVHMLKGTDDKWQINDVKIGEESILNYYKKFSNKLLKDYSFPYLVAELGEYPFITLEDFETSEVSKIPVTWTWKPKDDDKRKPYIVREEDDNKYLEATDDGESVILGRDVKWNLKKYPYVSFRWRTHKIPEGADERYDKKVDSAAGIYFIYKNKFGIIPESVKYVWSSTLPVGAAMQRKGVGKPWMVVAETGTDHLGEWRTYVFNLAEAYRDTYGGNPPSKPIGIGILSDANSIEGAHAYADYDDIRALRSADEAVDSGVREKMQTYQQ